MLISLIGLALDVGNFSGFSSVRYLEQHGTNLFCSVLLSPRETGGTCCPAVAPRVVAHQQGVRNSFKSIEMENSVGCWLKWMLWIENPTRWSQHLCNFIKLVTSCSLYNLHPHGALWTNVYRGWFNLTASLFLSIIRETHTLTHTDASSMFTFTHCFSFPERLSKEIHTQQALLIISGTIQLLCLYFCTVWLSIIHNASLFKVMCQMSV